AVGVLAALGLRLHDHARGQVGDADRRVGLVDVLAARAGGAEGVHAQVGGGDRGRLALLRDRDERPRRRRGVEAGLGRGLGPPAPEERKVSTRRSAGLISIGSPSSSTGMIATVAAEVWMRPWDSVSGTRCTRWVPDSNFSRAYAPAPSTRATTSRKPPCSPLLADSISTRHPWRSA